MVLSERTLLLLLLLLLMLLLFLLWLLLLLEQCSRRARQRGGQRSKRGREWAQPTAWAVDLMLWLWNSNSWFYRVGKDSGQNDQASGAAAFTRASTML